MSIFECSNNKCQISIEVVWQISETIFLMPRTQDLDLLVEPYLPLRQRWPVRIWNFRKRKLFLTRFNKKESILFYWPLRSNNYRANENTLALFDLPFCLLFSWSRELAGFFPPLFFNFRVFRISQRSNRSWSTCFIT